MKIKSLIAVLAFVAVSVSSQAQGVSFKFGYTNVEYILSQMPKAKQVDSEYKTYESQLQNQLQSKGQEFQTKLQEYQQGAATMTDIMRADKESELQNLQTRLETFQKDAQVSLQKKQTTLYAPLFEEIGNAIKAVRTENGYDAIFSTGVPGVDILLDADEKYDVSNLIFKKLGITPPAK
ncbi:OmpH family outer membrane protein [Reichenbachiella agarivorans]|uniref:OmpH family outer membrane protein n=1 Tax=Reichenbachiella agarivorans TaxID=2979464 RepID=A0ABY6CT61_9BACT|nr:OmpH family outer membrane protein [Reichenbachiella agarivorans]UXP33707.1 OmpH family outer membrane protein [Reichenbachiella agarivorans]